jgi:predicted dehydrogenase
MIQPLRCAVLSSAHVHAIGFAAALIERQDAELVALWDDDPARGVATAGQLGVSFAADLDQLLARPTLDAVIISSENVHHCALCLAACKAGKHVLCEKPLATTASDAEAMVDAAERAGVLLATAFPMRHSLPARQIRDALQAGTIGAVWAVRATNRGSLPPGWFLDPTVSGGGAVMDHTVHVADLLRWYLDDEPVKVYAEISHGLNGLAVEDAAFLTITFRSGVVATLDPSWSRPPSFPTWGDVTMEIAGEHGTLQLDAGNQKLVLSPKPGQHARWLHWGAGADAAMVADFVHAVRDGRRPLADGRDGERALAVALAAYDSARSGQPVPVAPPYGKRK